ncbi:MAG: CBS domain-containing protein [Anaerolineales bacterium]|nr:CBS domain-containing protein [Anaerolineales bacterium]
MTYMVQIILDDIKYMPEIIKAWREIGVSGTTIMKSVGGYRASTWLSKVGLAAVDHLFEAKEVQRRTLVAVIEEEELLEQAIAEAEQVVGGFDRPDSGILLVLPVSQTRGLYKVKPKPPQEVSPPAVRSDWKMLRDTPIEKVEAIMNLEATVVGQEASLNDVAQAMLEHPQVHIVSVVSEEGRLVGLLSLKSVADNLFFHILPEEFIAEITDLEKAMSFADRSRILTAGDAMAPPVWVKHGETVKNAFQRMHDNDLTGLPVVDDRYQVIGYINQLELIALCCSTDDEDSNPAEAAI